MVELLRELGPGQLTPKMGSLSDTKSWEYPRWPTWEPDEEADPEKIFVVSHSDRPVPVDPTDLPIKIQSHERKAENQGFQCAVF